MQTGAASAAQGGEQAAHAAAAGGHSLAVDPMHQFQVHRIIPIHIFGVDASFTNSSLYMLIAVALVTSFLYFAMRRGALVPGRLQAAAEYSYEFVANMVRETAGTEAMRFFPFVFTLFLFILALNLLGMIPYSFSVTSQIIITFALALTVFIGVTVIGFVKHGVGFLKFFVPSGVPMVLLPLLVVIEFISYLIRPISLSVRLFANMMAGHTMLKVFGAFVVAMGVLGGWAPLAFLVVFTALEVLVAFLQAFVFAILTCIYLNDALHMH
jgi:F-type H+-transporting ATPase subunit a